MEIVTYLADDERIDNLKMASAIIEYCQQSSEYNNLQPSKIANLILIEVGEDK